MNASFTSSVLVFLIQGIISNISNMQSSMESFSGTCAICLISNQRINSDLWEKESNCSRPFLGSVTSAVQAGEKEMLWGLMVTDGSPMALSQPGWEKSIPRAAEWELHTSSWSSIHDPAAGPTLQCCWTAVSECPNCSHASPGFSLQPILINYIFPSGFEGRWAWYWDWSHTQLLLPGKQPEPLWHWERLFLARMCVYCYPLTLWRISCCLKGVLLVYSLQSLNVHSPKISTLSGSNSRTALVSAVGFPVWQNYFYISLIFFF